MENFKDKTDETIPENKVLIKEIEALEFGINEDGLYKLFDGDDYRGFVEVKNGHIVEVQDNLQLEELLVGEETARKNHSIKDDTYNHIRATQSAFDRYEKMPDSENPPKEKNF